MIVSALLGVTMTVAMNQGTAKPDVKDLAWMSGAWECSIWGGTFQERWSEPAGGTMIGSGRLIAEGKTQFMEFMSVEPNKEGKLVMWMLLGSPSEGTKKGVPFTMTSSTKTEAVFENPKNDFPSKIMYKRSGDMLKCRIEGMQGGKPSHEDFDFKPIKG
jgi:hypothetical protein